MKYLKTFEGYEGKEEKKETTEIISDILSIAGDKKVNPIDIEKSVEKSIKGDAQSKDEVKNESVNDFLSFWWDLMSQTQYFSDSGDVPTLTAVGAWLATLVTTGLSATGIYKAGNAIKGLFGGKKVDFTNFVNSWCKKNDFELSDLDPKTEDGKKLKAKM